MLKEVLRIVAALHELLKTGVMRRCDVAHGSLYLSWLVVDKASDGNSQIAQGFCSPSRRGTHAKPAMYGFPQRRR